MKIIALEEHFVTPELAGYAGKTQNLTSAETWRKVSAQLEDIYGERLETMDRVGLDMEVLSLNSPGIQAEADPQTAVHAAARVNDFLAEITHDHPHRFAGFAALPLQDPAAAALELERSVTELGFCGALFNAHINGRYLDHPDFRIVWEKAAELDVPLYLHPALGVDSGHVFTDHPELSGPMWSWGVETATHALRLIFGGVFDDVPEAKLLLGHMGEGLPYVLWRLDSRWDWGAHHGIHLSLGRPSEYLKRNLYVTTSGACDLPPLRAALDALGTDHVLFGTDYPFEEMETAVDFIRTADISEDTRAKVAYENAERLLKIGVKEPAK